MGRGGGGEGGGGGWGGGGRLGGGMLGFVSYENVDPPKKLENNLALHLIL